MHFSSISQVKLRLTGTLQPFRDYTLNYGVYLYPTWLEIAVGSSGGPSPMLNGPYDYTYTCNPTSVSVSMLNGQFAINIMPNYD